MYAMNYEITLPADYDMQIIRNRVATKGAGTDNFPGLGLKAYCIRERGVADSPVNQYAPFYLWANLNGMHQFLWGDPFKALYTSFGRPVVQHWAGLAFERGPAFSVTPRAATRRAEFLPADAEPAPFIEEALTRLRQYASDPAVHSTAIAIDPRHWELVHFTLWRDTAPAEAGTRYEVLHLSAPQLGELETGRRW